MDERTDTTVCYRHPDRVTRLACSTCGRPICVECSHDAAVGQKCPECAEPQGRHRVVQGRQVFARPSFASSPVSFTLISVSVAIFVLGFASPAAERWFLETFAQANWLVAAGEWWRIFTAAFLHGSLMHILFNMYALYLFGPRLEQQVGRAAFAAMYFAAAGAGGAVSYIFGPVNQVSVGASGAIFGLFGAWLFVAWKQRATPGGRGLFNQLLVLLLINLALPLFLPAIDWRAHLGGLIAGAMIALIWSRLAVGRPNAGAIRTATAAGVIVLDIVAVLLL